MLCPFCGSENLDGADTCELCQTSLIDPAGLPLHVVSLDEKITHGRIALLHPAEAVTAEASDPVRGVIALLAERNFGCALVVRAGQLAGIFTERDALMKVGTDVSARGNEPVSDFMTPAPEMLLYSDTIAFALNRMAVGDYRHIPVKRRDGSLGIISVRDVLAYITRSFPELLADAPA